MASAYLVIIFALCHLSAIEGLLPTRPRQPCLASAIVRGPCHDCLCTAEGLYHCREVPCRENFTEQLFVTQCQPLQVYQAKNFICECTSSGRWKSQSCQDLFQFMQATWSSPQKKLQARVACVPFTLYVIGCNVCMCPRAGLIDAARCSNRRCIKGLRTAPCRFGDLIRHDNVFCACTDANIFIDRRCVKIGRMPFQQVEPVDLARMLNIERSWLQEECKPQERYWIDCNNCTCDKFGSLQCTNNECLLPEREDGANFRRNGPTLLKLEDENQNCTPGHTYRVHCNTCVCSTVGKLHCTTMVCLDQLVDSIEPL